MKRTRTYEDDLLRVYWALGIMICMLSALVLMLARIQVMQGADFERNLRQQSLRRVRLPGIRGLILDRNGVYLAENRPCYDVAVYLDEIRQFSKPGKGKLPARVNEVLSRVAVALHTNVTLSLAEIDAHCKKRSLLPLVAWRDVNVRTRALLAESGTNFPGIDIYLESVRMYSQGTMAAHLLGYVGRANPADSAKDGDEEDEETYNFYLPEMEGRHGLEKTQDGLLRGEAGGQVVRVDAAGMRRSLPGDEEQIREPTPGCDVRLTLDARLQRVVEEALGDARGAGVVLDPRTGDVLALASAPTFDPNALSSGLSVESWNAIAHDTNSPLLNRAVSGTYAPGSCFKPVVAAAALERAEGISPATTFTCPGYYAMGNTQLKCWIWKQGGHGALDMRRGIEQSCNVYFCNLGVRAGYRAIQEFALGAGFGRVTGLEVESEARGRVPRPEEVRTRGDVANLSIGQGALEVTPLQMATFVGAIGLRGKSCRPRLILGVRRPGSFSFEATPTRPFTLDWAPSTFAIVRAGMHDVIHAPSGTGRNALVEGVTMAGKTGTAEFGRDEHARKWGWMMVFAPFDQPRYAIVMLVENADSGGRTVAPKIRRIVSYLFGKETEPDESG